MREVRALLRIARELLAGTYHEERLRELAEERREEVPVLLEGPHSRKWHSCPVLGHIEWTLANAKAAYRVADIDIREIAALHDIGKILNAEIEPDGSFDFKGHEISGADFLKLKKNRSWHKLNDEDIDIIGSHGKLRKQDPSALRLTKKGIKKLMVLELCDEFSKWSKQRLPPSGDMTKLLAQRQRVIDGAKKYLGASVTNKIVAAFSECI